MAKPSAAALGRKPGQKAKAPAKPRAARKPKATVEA
ncbi:hypothetical protein J3E64_002689 [Sphingobium sp. OAS761]|nr:hypothetical protein [Sphingobium sp. OAS761]